MQVTLNFFNDPGHGWLAVKRQWLHDLGIAQDITTFSYQRGKSVYLEEDCDASRFLAAARAAGWDITFNDKYCDRHSPIRSYDYYRKGE